MHRVRRRKKEVDRDVKTYTIWDSELNLYYRYNGNYTYMKPMAWGTWKQARRFRRKSDALSAMSGCADLFSVSLDRYKIVEYNLIETGNMEDVEIYDAERG